MMESEKSRFRRSVAGGCHRMTPLRNVDEGMGSVMPRERCRYAHTPWEYTVRSISGELLRVLETGNWKQYWDWVFWRGFQLEYIKQSKRGVRTWD
jgi:hypothetical protein